MPARTGPNPGVFVGDGDAGIVVPGADGSAVTGTVAGTVVGRVVIVVGACVVGRTVVAMVAGFVVTVVAIVVAVVAAGVFAPIRGLLSWSRRLIFAETVFPVCS